MRKLHLMKWIIWALAAIFYFYEYLLRVSPSVIVSELMESFHVNAASVGVLSAFFLYAYAPMQLPVGILMDRYGARILLTVASLICGIGSLLFGIAHNLGIASFGRLLIGAGSSFAFVGMVFVCSHWFPLRKRALMVGLANSIGMLGASAGQGPLSLVIYQIGWRISMILLAIAGIVLGAIIFILVRDDPESSKKKTEKKQNFSELLQNLKLVCINPHTWINALVAVGFYMTTTAFGGLWGIPFLQTAYGLSKNTASFALSMVFIGWLIGGPISGFLSDRMGKRKPIILISIFLTFCALFPIIYIPTLSVVTIYILLLLVGIFSSAQLLNFSLAIELNSSKAKGSAAALTNALIATAGSGMQPLIGIILVMGWNGKMVGGIPSYSTGDYQTALTALPISLVIAFILGFFIKETRTKVHTIEVAQD